VPNCFCSGVINIHELSPAAKIKLADDKNLLLAAATCCIIVKQQSQKRRRRRRFWIHPVHQDRDASEEIIFILFMTCEMIQPFSAILPLVRGTVRCRTGIATT